MTIRQTLLSFTLPLAPTKVRAFRGAMAEKAGLGHDLFHNHDNSNGGTRDYHHRYPLIQYASWHDHAMITGLNEGSDELHAFIGRYDGKLKIMQEVQPMKIKAHLTQQFQLALTAELHHYRIRQWLLREEKLAEWQSEQRLTHRLELLEGWLSNSVISFAHGIGWRIPGRFDLHLTENPTVHRILNSRKLAYLSFDVEVATNLVLPPLVGLGKSASEGFGRIYPQSFQWRFD